MVASHGAPIEHSVSHVGTSLSKRASLHPELSDCSSPRLTSARTRSGQCGTGSAAAISRSTSPRRIRSDAQLRPATAM